MSIVFSLFCRCGCRSLMELYSRGMHQCIVPFGTNEGRTNERVEAVKLDKGFACRGIL